MTAVTTNTGEVLQVPANQISSGGSPTAQLLNNNNRTLSSTMATQLCKSSSTESSIQVSGTTPVTNINNQIAVTGQIIKGGSSTSTKGTTTISSINLSGLMAGGSGKIALKALPSGQLLLSQPLEGKLTALVKSDQRQDLSVDDGKMNLVQLKSDNFQQLELSKLLQLNSKSSQHQLAVTTSTLSVAIPTSSLNSLKGAQKSSSVLARALKNQLSTSQTGITTVLGSPDSQVDESVLGGQGVILGVTMEEGTLIDNGDGTLSELAVIE